MPGTCRVWSASRTPTDAPAILSDNSPQQSDALCSRVVRETDSWSSGYLDFLLIFFLSFYLLDYYQAITWRINWRRLILSHSGNQLATKMRVRMGSEVLCRIIPTPSVGGETRKVRQIRSGYFSLSGLYGLGCCCCCCGSLLVIHARAAECLTTIRLCLGCVSLEKKKRDVDQKRTTTREEKEEKKEMPRNDSLIFMIIEAYKVERRASELTNWWNVSCSLRFFLLAATIQTEQHQSREFWMYISR